MAPSDQNISPANEETPVPGTAAEDGRRKFGAYAHTYRPGVGEVQAAFFHRVATALSIERLESYGADAASPTIALARYLLNLALCESLYSPLQLCEVALRNTLHRHLSARLSREDWYDAAGFSLTDWGRLEVSKAKEKIAAASHPVTPGRVVAELQFGFWTSLFEAHYEGRSGFLPAGIRFLFPRLPKSLHNRKGLKRTLEEIRLLRNRVFHHERIVHWTDLEARHRAILDVIGWISPELLELAVALDRFSAIRRDGLDPWIGKIKAHWPHQEPPPDDPVGQSPARP